MLKVLPENISNLIAAGEVIQRPSSVVKELLENAVDADSNSITLIINDYGKTLIQVLDDGIGMNRDEATICFESHATSKIDTIEDLQKIHTFGFRGEALASIAACAEVTLKTRKRGEDVGTKVHIEGGKIVEVAETATPQGTNIAVRNIFYNIPARRKFLKSDAAEYRQILNEFIRVSLTRINIDFKFINNSKEILRLVANETLKQRIAKVISSNLMKISKELIEIKLDTKIVGISGYVGTPHSAKKTQQNTYLFVNQRYFRSPILHKAIMNGYSKLLTPELLPSYFIFLTVPDGEYDINISPSKTEAKFENEQAIFQILESTVKEAIGKNAFADAIEFGDDSVPREISSADGFTLTPEEEKKLREKSFPKPRISYDPLFNPFKQDYKIEQEREVYQIEQFISLEDNLVAIANPKGDGVMILDIVRAKQKIFFDNYLNNLNKGSVAIQEELFPKSVSLNHPEYKALMDNVEILKKIGFEIRSFGKDCIVVSGTPSNFSGEKFSVEECIEEIAYNLVKNGGSELSKVLNNEQMALKVTAHTNFTPTISITQSYVNELVKQLLNLENSAICPRGGYCYTIISNEQLKKSLL